MSKELSWESFLDAIALNQKDDADAAMRDMARSIQHTQTRAVADSSSAQVPAYIQEHADYQRAMHRAGVDAYRKRLAAEEHMHPHMRETLDSSCNPYLSAIEQMRERGD